MSLDFNALDSSAGTAPRAPLSMFYEDPDQPRTEFDTRFLEDFAEEIKEAGTIHTAINVRPPDPDGRMKIIHGGNRYRASVLAGVLDIPYLIQTDTRVFDAYSQVSENQRRRSLSPKDLARFIQDRVQRGESQSHVAKKLGMAKADITYHLVLVHGPDFILSLYDQKRCVTPKYLYELANLAKTHPDQVQEFCATSDDFSRYAIRALTERLKKNEPRVSRTNAGSGSALSSAGLAGADTQPPADASSDSAALVRSGSDATASRMEESGAGVSRTNATPQAAVHSIGSGLSVTTLPGGVSQQGPAVVRVGRHPEGKGHTGGGNAMGKSEAPSSQLGQPVLGGKHAGRDAIVLLDRSPSKKGMVFVRYAGTDAEAEVSLGMLKQPFLTHDGI